MILGEAFPSLKLTEKKLEIWALLLKDLTEEQFVKGVTKFCLEHPEIYPGTNIIAHIRNYGLGKKKRDLRSEAVLIYHLYRSQRGLPDYVDIDALAVCMEMTNRMSTGLDVDAVWDEKRFIDLYVGMIENC